MTVKTAAMEVIGMMIAQPDAWTATKFLSPSLTIKATRRYKFRPRTSRSEFVVTVGEPNYFERKYIQRAQKAKRAFPIKKIWVFS